MARGAATAEGGTYFVSAKNFPFSSSIPAFCTFFPVPEAAGTSRAVPPPPPASWSHAPGWGLLREAGPPVGVKSVGPGQAGERGGGRGEEKEEEEEEAEAATAAAAARRSCWRDSPGGWRTETR